MKKRPSVVTEFFSSEDPNVYVIHCTTTDFNEHPVRLTSICIRHTKSSRERVFIPRSSPAQTTNIDDWEREILKEFQEFMQTNPRVRWVHWSMTGENFGWPLIQRRSAEHGIPDYTEGLIDLNLNRFLERKYGANYEKHGHFYNLIKRNRFTHPEMLSGTDEAALAKDLNKESIAKLINSCGAKADAIHEVLQAEETGKLKTSPLTKETLFDKLSWIKSVMLFLAGTAAKYAYDWIAQHVALHF